MEVVRQHNKPIIGPPVWLFEEHLSSRPLICILILYSCPYVAQIALFQVSVSTFLVAVWLVGRAWAVVIFLPCVSSVVAALSQATARIWAVLVRLPCVSVAAVLIAVTTAWVIRVSFTFVCATHYV